MNFVALIGIINKIENQKDFLNLNIKVEKPFVKNDDDDWFDLLDVKICKSDFEDEISKIEKGGIVGIKGRMVNFNSVTNLVADRLQVF